jgi:hypothetical protein
VKITRNATLNAGFRVGNRLVGEHQRPHAPNRRSPECDAKSHTDDVVRSSACAPALEHCNQSNDKQ